MSIQREFRVGDVVRFKESEDLSGQEFTVFEFIKGKSHSPKDKVRLIERLDYGYEDACELELVRECPYNDGDKIALKAVYWNEDEDRFGVDDVVGTFRENGDIQFEKLVMSCDFIPYPCLDAFYGSTVCYGNQDVIFCLATKEKVTKAQKRLLDVETARLEECQREFQIELETKTKMEEAIAAMD